MSEKNKIPKVRFSIDRGGTFTDVYAEWGKNNVTFLKLLSEDPAHYQDASLEGIRRVLKEIFKDSRGETDTDIAIESIRMGTTVATNALLERKGERIAFVTTKGFRDLLQIGYQNRPEIFDLKITKPTLLYETVLEVDERIRPATKKERGGKCLKGLNGDYYTLLSSPDPNKIRQDLQHIFDSGICSIAIAFLHSYAWPEHEKIVGQVAREVGFTQISLSSDIMPMVKIVPRGDTSVADAYLTPIINTYLKGFQAGLTKNIAPKHLLFMQSDGGLSPANLFRGSNAVLSGPAGGVVGYGITAYCPKIKKPVIGFDMGGTSTDVSRYGGEYEIVHESETAGVRIQAPQLNIKTVAAGGGSRLFYRNDIFQVGPESAGAHPGPVCYRKDGYLTVTDANLVLGYINPDFFPHIFGPQENLPLDVDASRQAFQQLTDKINSGAGQLWHGHLSVEETAAGFLEVANQTMARPIREISVMRGHDIKTHVLANFGGAGGQHACSIARMLGIKEIVIHRYSGILSAYGLGLADVVVEKQIPSSLVYSPDTVSVLHEKLDQLAALGSQNLEAQGFAKKRIVVKKYLNLRYDGTNNSYMVLEPENGDWQNAFRQYHLREFGFDLSKRKIVVDDLRIRACGKSPKNRRKKIAIKETPSPLSFIQCYFGKKWHETPVFQLEDLGTGFSIQGPALLINHISTVVLEPDSNAVITKFGDIHIKILPKIEKITQTQADPIQLAIFSNLFMSIAEQMGRTLQRTALSTNIKERLDFSCALFDCAGNLVANAPHIPVHLGSMGSAVKKQIKIHLNDLKPGTVLVSNHPAAGGSHLPDITVITPVWLNNKIIFFTAARGHHGDIGGSTPGSMPPFSKNLQEEGIQIFSFKIVENGVFQEDALLEILKGSRKIEDNISDLKAQIAATRKGNDLLMEMVEKYSLRTIMTYMEKIQQGAENAVRRLLKNYALNLGLENHHKLTATEYMDDGTPIKIRITVNPEDGSAIFDFSGTGKQVSGNWNCPKSVVLSAILYTLRVLLDTDIPLNQGCLTPIDIIVPDGSILSPSADAAIVGGNVMTSQRIVDVLLKAFNAAAGSQGCMNNLSFGTTDFGYYETIGGGAGAGPDWHGQSGVHSHMTNTRITDPEILENRHPVLLKTFALRKGSGGKGKFNGGDGLVREIEALEKISASILSDRRVYPPYGIEGGQPGATGENYHIKQDGTQIDLGGKNSVELLPGERIVIMTPGGGGFGRANEK